MYPKIIAVRHSISRRGFIVPANTKYIADKARENRYHNHLLVACDYLKELMNNPTLVSNYEQRIYGKR